VREHGEIFLNYRDVKERGAPRVYADEVDGLRTVELVAAAYASAREGTTVPVARNPLD
jgi:hypothetical protein